MTERIADRFKVFIADTRKREGKPELYCDFAGTPDEAILFAVSLASRYLLTEDRESIKHVVFRDRNDMNIRNGEVWCIQTNTSRISCIVNPKELLAYNIIADVSEDDMKFAESYNQTGIMYGDDIDELFNAIA